LELGALTGLKTIQTVWPKRRPNFESKEAAMQI
jgi:hypothetical protein